MIQTITEYVGFALVAGCLVYGMFIYDPNKGGGESKQSSGGGGALSGMMSKIKSKAPKSKPAASSKPASSSKPSSSASTASSSKGSSLADKFKR